MLVLDALRTTQESAVALRAFRLKRSFINLYKGGVFTVETYAM